MGDGITDVFGEAIENPYAITGVFDAIKLIFNEFLFILYYIYFFLVFLLFVVLAIGFFVYLPIKIAQFMRDNKNIIKQILNFDIVFLLEGVAGGIEEGGKLIRKDIRKKR